MEEKDGDPEEGMYDVTSREAAAGDATSAPPDLRLKCGHFFFYKSLEMGCLA